jgi:glycosyltransferase involved in cell wall biosynthesis
MKILYISPKLPYPLNEGGKIAIFGEIKYFFLQGHEVELITYPKDDKDESIKIVEQYCKIHFVNHSTKNNILQMILNLFSSVPYNVSKYHSNKLLAACKKLINDFSPDIIHISNLHMGFVVDKLRKITQAKFVLRQHNVEGQIMKRFYENESNFILKYYAKLQYRKFIAYEPKLCEKFDKVVFITENDKKYLEQINPNIKSAFIPAGVEKSFLLLNKNNIDEFAIFHTGSLNWLPNLDSAKYFIEEILPIIVDKEPRVRFYLYGGKLPSTFIIPQKVKKNVIQLGFVDDLWNDLTNKFIAVVPLRIGSGMRLKVIELMAAGNVVISTSIGKEGINVIDSKHLFVEDSPINFAEKCLEVVGNYSKYSHLINSARKFVEENYTWDSIIKNYESVFEENSSFNKE